MKRLLFFLCLVSTALYAAKGERPQTPQPPYFYLEEEVLIDCGAHQLAGTLTLPSGKKRDVPTVLLVAGSGPLDRDERICGHRIFHVIADCFTRHGFAVLRCDKRGIGASTGDYAVATTYDFADDASSAVNYLKRRPEVGTIGLIGHSEGGMIAPFVAAHNDNVSWVVMMAAPGVQGRELLRRQAVMMCASFGYESQETETYLQFHEMLCALIEQYEDADQLKAAFEEELEAFDQVEPEIFRKVLHRINLPWMRCFLQYDPAPTLAHVHVPVLAMSGEKDTQVCCEQNLPAIEKGLEHNTDVTITRLSDLNHLFQTCTTGSILEYSQIEETIAPYVLDLMVDWAARH